MCACQIEDDPLSPVVNNDPNVVQYYIDHRLLEEAVAKKADDVDFLKKLWQMLQMMKDPMLEFVRMRDEFLPTKEHLTEDDQVICARKLEGMATLTNLMAEFRTQFNDARNWPVVGEHWEDGYKKAQKFVELFEAITHLAGVEDFSSVIATQLKTFEDDFNKNVIRPDLREKYHYGAAPLALWVMVWFSCCLFGNDDNGCWKKPKDSDPMIFVAVVKEAFMYMDQLQQYTESSSSGLHNLVKQSVADGQTMLGVIEKTQQEQVEFEKLVNRLSKKHP